MLKLKTLLVASALLALTCLATQAKANVTYVSGKGNDSGNCSSPANPCRTFQFAVNQTAAGGEVKALDPADYHPVVINKSISITGVDGAGIDTNGGNGVTITNNASIAISLANLIVQNFSGTGNIGISASTGNFNGFSLKITHCIVRGFSNGIFVGFANPFLITDTVATNNQIGIAVARSSGTLDHVVAFQNSSGVSIGHNAGNVFLAQSTITQNGTGIDLGPNTVGVGPPQASAIIISVATPPMLKAP